MIERCNNHAKKGGVCIRHSLVKWTGSVWKNQMQNEAGHKERLKYKDRNTFGFPFCVEWLQVEDIVLLFGVW